MAKSTRVKVNKRALAANVREFFKGAFYNAMQKYAPIADGWLRSCGMFKVVAKTTGQSVVLSVVENPKRAQKSIYWKEVERGSTEPPGFRMWCEAPGGPNSRGDIVRQVFSDKIGDTAHYYYWERRYRGGTWENAKITRFKHPVVRRDASESPFTTRGHSNKGRWNFTNRNVAAAFTKKLGKDRRFWVTKKAIKRRGVPFMDAVCAEAVNMTVAAINTGALDMKGFKFEHNIKSNDANRLAAIRRYRTIARREDRIATGRYRAILRNEKKDAYRGIASDKLINAREVRDVASMRREAVERVLKQSTRDAYMSEWRQKMLKDPRAWQSEKLRDWHEQLRAKKRFDWSEYERARSTEMKAFERRFGLSPSDVGRANAAEAGENPWDHISKWW